MEEWLPRACRAFFGNEVGSRILPVYNSGVQPFYIMTPGRAIVLANKMRRKPLAAVDPSKKAEDTIGEAAAPDIIDSAKRMAFQVEATGKALAALQDTYPHRHTSGPYRRKLFMYHYKWMPAWHMIAAARNASTIAGELQRNRKYAESIPVLEAGLETFEKNLARVKDVLEQTKDEPGLSLYGPLHLKTRGIKPEELKQLLLNRMASAKVVLKPRKPGETILVAVHQGLGENGTKAFLDQFENVKTDIIHTLSLATLEKYDCLFVLQTAMADRLDFFHNLPRYVREGGRGIVFQHDMCGRDRRGAFGNETPFPEICPGTAGREDAFEIVVKTRHPVLPGLKKGQELTHMYYDCLFPQAGEKGTVVVVGKGGEPIVVVGESGPGKVVFDGNVNLTKYGKDELLTGINAVLAQGAVEWLTGVKLRKK